MSKESDIELNKWALTLTKSLSQAWQPRAKTAVGSFFAKRILLIIISLNELFKTSEPNHCCQLLIAIIMAKQESTVIRGWSNKVAKMPPKVALIVVLYKVIFYIIAQTSLIFLGCFCKEQIGCQELFLKLPNLVTLQESQKFLECKSGYFDHGVPCFDAS